MCVYGVCECRLDKWLINCKVHIVVYRKFLRDNYFAIKCTIDYIIILVYTIWIENLSAYWKEK